MLKTLQYLPFIDPLTVDTLARKWRRFIKEFQKRQATLVALNEVTLSDDRERWETTRREFEALRIEDPCKVDGLLDHPDNRMRYVPFAPSSG